LTMVGREVIVVAHMTTTTNRKLHQHLSALGFGDYEIRAYVALLAKGAMNGYQLAKISGVPRPNIYGVLERLRERGAVTGSEVEGGTEYQAIPAEEMLAGLSRSFQSSVTQAKTALQEVQSHVEQPMAWNVRGYEGLLEKAEKIIRSAKRDVFLALWPQEAGPLTAALASVLKRGIKPTILCVHGCEQECGGCAGHIYRYPAAGKNGARSFVLIVDQQIMVMGDIQADGSAIGAHSHSAAMITVATQYILNAIAVSEIVRSLGPELLKIVDPQAMAALKGAGLAMNHQSWFDRVFSSVQQTTGKNQQQ
jgi:HTH-type transcriptional regulator, sugar sensing transcriptional regulator